MNWKDIGLTPYGNSLVVNGAYLEKNPKLAEDFVRISQKAFAACVADVTPCLKALLDQVSGSDKENQERRGEPIKFRSRCSPRSPARQGKPGAAVGTHQVPDDRRFHHHKSAGLDRCRADEQGLRTGADLSRHGKAVRGRDRVFDKTARSLDQDGCQQGQ